MHNFKKLEVWKKATELAILVYQITAKFPKEERFGLIYQLRKCSVSISSNISEGAGRGSDLEFCRFIHYSYGSTCELYTQFLISQKMEYIGTREFNHISDKIDEIQKMLYKLTKTLKK